MAKLAKAGTRTVIRISNSYKLPNAKRFLLQYFALDRPNTSHLFFSRGIIDFLLGMVIGILIGLIIAIMVGIQAT